MDAEFFEVDEDDLDNIVERRGDIESEFGSDNESRPRGDDEAIEAPVPKKKDDKDDKEIKKRTGTPRPKLDSNRLASNRGLLALETEMKGIVFRGKGHELEDINLVLGKLQHWAHRLFPSYTFDDCLDKLEKLGTKKTVNVQLKKIRMGLTSAEDEHDTTIRGDAQDDEPPPSSSITAHEPTRSHMDIEFDNVMATARPMQNHPIVVPAPATQSTGLTEEQKERILRNRLAAEERRLARLKEQQQEKELLEREAALADEVIEQEF